MKTKLILLLLLIAVTACSKDAIESIEPDMTYEETVKSDAQQYIVSESMLRSYLSLVKKIDNVKSITPIKDSGELTAYLVNYQDGWELISADTRCFPILASASDGTLDWDAQDPGSAAVRGTLMLVHDKRNSGIEELDPMWSLFVKSKESTNGSNRARRKIINSERNGMWIPVDTVYYSDTYDSGHTIKTAWGQDSPWNSYVPCQYDLGILKRCQVGCVAVAAGQIIAHFRMKNPRGIAIPTSATAPTEQGETMVVNTSSASGWSAMANDYNGEVTQMFLALIGSKVCMNYGVYASSASSSNCASVFSEYLLDYYLIHFGSNTTSGSQGNGANIAYMSIIAQPLNTTDHYRHACILDRNGWEKSYVAINYEWDPDHYQTDEEIQQLPMWMLSPIDNGKGLVTEYTEYLSYSERHFIGINWGFGGTSNNVTYSTHISYQPEDDYTGYEDAQAVARYMNPYWTFYGNNVQRTYTEKNLTYINFREH